MLPRTLPQAAAMNPGDAKADILSQEILKLLLGPARTPATHPAHPPSNMSANRAPWEPSEISLLRQIRSVMPMGTLNEVTRAFTERNFQKRSKNAVKAKLTQLGLNRPSGYDKDRILTPSEEHSSIPSHPLFGSRSASSVPKLGIFIPLHPLIVEARRHAARSLTPGHASGVSETSKWPSLGDVDISKLRCTEKDRVALRNYFDYITR